MKPGHRDNWLFLAAAAALLSAFAPPVPTWGRVAAGAVLGALLLLCLLRMRHLQATLQFARRRYRQVLDHAGDAIFFIDPRTGTLQEVNQRAEELLGYKAAEFPELPLRALFPGSSRLRYRQLVKKVLEEGYGEEPELTIRRKDGSHLTGAVHARLGRLGTREVVHGTLRDVTAVRAIERELRQKNRDLTLLNKVAHLTTAHGGAEQMLQSTLEATRVHFKAAGGGIYQVRHQGNEYTLLASHGIDENTLDGLEQLSPGRGLIGRVAGSGTAHTSTDLQKDTRVASAAVRRAGWRGFIAVPLATRDKTLGVLFLFSLDERSFETTEIDLLKALGKQVGAALEGSQLYDALKWQFRLTEASNRELEQSRQQLRANLERLEEANQGLEQLGRMKSQFLALASHELRTPLTYIISATELLAGQLSGRLTPDELRTLEALQQGGARLDAIIRDLLQVARIEARDLYLAQEQVDLPRIFQDLHLEFAPVLAERQLACRIGPFPDHLALRGDSQHLGSTFRRLLENAVKFTPQGGSIEISAAPCSAAWVRGREEALKPFSPDFFREAPDGEFLRVSVRDDGVGIDAAERLKIFDKFYEIGDISSHFTSRTGFGGKGVGLGLALVKGMVEAHGGMVWVESQGAGTNPDGSAFHVLLPACAEGR